MKTNYHIHISSRNSKYTDILRYTPKYLNLGSNTTLKSAYEGLKWTTTELNRQPNQPELVKLQQEYFTDLWKISKKLSPNLFYLR